MRKCRDLFYFSIWILRGQWCQPDPSQHTRSVSSMEGSTQGTPGWLHVSTKLHHDCTLSIQKKKNLDFARLKMTIYIYSCLLLAFASWRQQVSPRALQQKHWLLPTLQGIKHFHLLCFSHVKTGFYHDISLPLCIYSRSYLQYCILGWTRYIQQFWNTSLCL